MKCHSCRTFGRPMWPGAAGPCCRESITEVAATPDVAQWLRIRAIRVAWLIGARRHVPGLTAKERA